MEPSCGIVEPSYESIDTTFRPYVRYPSRGSKVYNIFKTIISVLILVPLRLLLLCFTIVFAYLVAKIAMCGFANDDKYVFKVLPRWRAMLLMLLRPLVRIVLFSLGVVWIKEKKIDWSALPPLPDQTPPVPCPYSKAFVIVANHIGYIDILILAAKYGGAFVAKEEIATTPVVGTIATALQTLFLHKDRPLTESLIDRVKATYAAHDASKHEPGHICGCCLSTLAIFPEGTTENGQAMVKFRTGIFLAGLPVQPVAIRCPFKHFSMSWESIWFRTHLFSTLTQFVNHVELIELPIYTPSLAECTDPKRFSTNVQALISAVLSQPIYLLNKKHKTLYHQTLLGKLSAEDALRQAKEVTLTDSTLHLH